MPEHSKQPAIDAKQLLGRITSEFPELKCSAYELVTDGWDHAVIILDDQIVFRFPITDEYRALLRSEIAALSYIHLRTPVFVPYYRYVAEDFSFAGYDKIEGDRLSPELLRSLDKQTQETIATQLAAFLTSHHNTNLSEISFDGITESYVSVDQPEIKAHAETYLPSVLSDTEMEQVRSILKDIDLLIASETPVVLVHGDFYSNHLFWNGTRSLMGVIDFSDMAKADPALDFAELYEYGEEFVNLVYSSYDRSKDKTFLERAWKYQQWVGVYMMTDHFISNKTSFEIARQTFDRCNSKKR